MSRRFLSTLTALLLLIGAFKFATANTVGDTEVGRDIVRDFYQMGFVQGDLEGAFSIFVAKDYVSHAENGLMNIEPSKSAMVRRLQAMPDRQIEIKRMLTDEDTVAVQAFWRAKKKDREYLECVDIFRIQNEKIVEHWSHTAARVSPEETRTE